MSDDREKQEKRYPLRSLHDFLYELDTEWDRFRTGSLIGLVVSGALLVFSVFRFLSALRNRAFFDIIFMLIIIVALVYTVSALLAQHRFFKRWERRIGLLLHMEEEILGEELDEKNE